MKSWPLDETNLPFNRVDETPAALRERIEALEARVRDLEAAVDLRENLSAEGTERP